MSSSCWSSNLTAADAFPLQLTSTLSLQNQSELCPASNLPSKGCWVGKSKNRLLIPYLICSKFRQRHCSSRISLFMSRYVSDTWMSKPRTGQNKSYMLASNWQQNLSQWISVYIGKLFFTISTTNFRRWTSLTPDLLSSFCFLYFWNSHFIQSSSPLVTKVPLINITAAEPYHVALKKCEKR